MEEIDFSSNFNSKIAPKLLLVFLYFDPERFWFGIHITVPTKVISKKIYLHELILSLS